MKKPVKIVAIVLAAVVAVSAVSGVLIFAFTRYSNKNFTVLEQDFSEQNTVAFKETVKVSDNAEKLQKKLKKTEKKDGIYTLSYSKKLPEFFGSLEKDDVFCVYPDKDSDNQLFALGFCGKVVETDTKSISYVLPEMTDVFSSMHISTEGVKTAGTKFTPADGVSVITAGVGTPNLAARQVTNGEIGSLRFRYVAPSKTPKLDNYILLNDELILKFKHTIDCIDGLELGVDGKVTLEDTAVKFLMDYTYNEQSESVTINEYSLGFVTKQKVDLEFSSKGTIGLDDITFDPYELIPMPSLSIDDATSSEEGKIVLGTYVIGLNAYVPVIGDLLMTHNKVSLLSFGIAIQLSVTASGELSLSCNISESGFAQFEINSDGNNTCLVKGYDYPNPVVSTATPTEEQASSLPNISCSAKGDVAFHAGVGVDIGLCIFGIIPIKQSNNLIDIEMGKTIFNTADEKGGAQIMRNNYLVNDNIDYLIIGSKSSCIVYIGASASFGPLVYDYGHMGVRVDYYIQVLYQTPPPTGFSKAETGFGGVFVGEEYKGKKLENTFNEYMKDTDQDSFLNKIKDATVGSAVNTVIDTLDVDLGQLIEELGGTFEAEGYDVTYMSSGAIYIRDGDTVVASIVLGDQIGNKAGIHTELSQRKIKQIYSAPTNSMSVDLGVTKDLATLLGIKAIDDIAFTVDIYNSSDSNHEMLLLYTDDELKMIVITGAVTPIGEAVEGMK